MRLFIFVTLTFALNANLLYSQTTYDVHLRLSDAQHKGILEFGFADVVFENALEGDGYSLQIKNWFNSSYNNTLKINGNGNIGIGTTTPSAKLEVKGDLKLNDGTASHKGVLRFGLDDFIIENSPDGGSYADIQFKNWNGSGYTNSLRINHNGNVGIGTSTPDAKLAVKGTIHAQEVKVDLNVTGPDYVFEKNYNLLSLSEIETYIQQNKHLPEVPSAKEMEQNGINLSEMNMLLLKKVEELTLYVIELKKENEAQRVQFGGQQAEIESIKAKVK